MVEFTVDDVSVKAETKPDLFSPKGLDQGTQLLLECVPKFEFNTVLDWGCGWGAIGLWVAVGFPTTRVVALDSDIAAVKATTFNIELNELTNLEVFPSHGFDVINSETKFDLICSNPPTHRGRQVVEDMIRQSVGHLNKDGHLLVVVESRLKPWVARCMKEAFGDYKIEKRGPKNVVLSGHKVLDI